MTAHFIPTLDPPYSVAIVATDEWAVYKNGAYIGGFEYIRRSDPRYCYAASGVDGIDDYIGSRPTAGEAIDFIIETYNG